MRAAQKQDLFLIDSSKCVQFIVEGSTSAIVLGTNGVNIGNGDRSRQVIANVCLSLEQGIALRRTCSSKLACNHAEICPFSLLAKDQSVCINTDTNLEITVITSAKIFIITIPWECNGRSKSAINHIRYE